MKTHELKILPEYFEAVASGRKQFEIRKNDRGYNVGDLLHLREWNGEDFTGNSYKAEITYITDYAQKDGYVVMGIRARESGLKVKDRIKLASKTDDVFIAVIADISAYREPSHKYLLDVYKNGKYFNEAFVDEEFFVKNGVYKEEAE